LPLGLELSRFVRALLFGVLPGNAAGMAWTAVLILLGTVAASLLPGTRAVRVDPVRALRAE
jgi:hypothetical protein